MESRDEELQAAKAAKNALDNLSPNIGATICNAHDIAAHAAARFPSHHLDDARCIVVGELTNLLDASEDALLEKVVEAKAAIEEWIDCLETS
jgi:hypothetical protein